MVLGIKNDEKRKLQKKIIRHIDRKKKRVYSVLIKKQSML